MPRSFNKPPKSSDKVQPKQIPNSKQATLDYQQIGHPISYPADSIVLFDLPVKRSSRMETRNRPATYIPHPTNAGDFLMLKQDITDFEPVKSPPVITQLDQLNSGQDIHYKSIEKIEQKHYQTNAGRLNVDGTIILSAKGECPILIGRSASLPESAQFFYSKSADLYGISGHNNTPFEVVMGYPRGQVSSFSGIIERVPVKAQYFNVLLADYQLFASQKTGDIPSLVYRYLAQWREEPLSNQASKLVGWLQCVQEKKGVCRIQVLVAILLLQYFNFEVQPFLNLDAHIFLKVKVGNQWRFQSYYYESLAPGILTGDGDTDVEERARPIPEPAVESQTVSVSEGVVAEPAGIAMKHLPELTVSPMKVSDIIAQFVAQSTVDFPERLIKLTPHLSDLTRENLMPQIPELARWQQIVASNWQQWSLEDWRDVYTQKFLDFQPVIDQMFSYWLAEDGDRPSQVLNAIHQVQAIEAKWLTLYLTNPDLFYENQQELVLRSLLPDLPVTIRHHIVAYYRQWAELPLIEPTFLTGPPTIHHDSQTQWILPQLTRMKKLESQIVHSTTRQSHLDKLDHIKVATNQPDIWVSTSSTPVNLNVPIVIRGYRSSDEIQSFWGAFSEAFGYQDQPDVWWVTPYFIRKVDVEDMDEMTTVVSPASDVAPLPDWVFQGMVPGSVLEISFEGVG